CCWRSGIDGGRSLRGRRRIDGDWEKQLAGSFSSPSALPKPSRPGGRLSRDNRGREAALRDRANRSRADYVVQYSIDHQQQDPPLPALARIFEIAHQILLLKGMSRQQLGPAVGGPEPRGCALSVAVSNDRDRT